MRKICPCALVLFLVAACHCPCKKQTSAALPSVEETSVAAAPQAPITDEKPTEITASSVPQVQTEQQPAAAAAAKIVTNPKPQTPRVTVTKAVVPATEQITTPAPFTPTFKGEEIINTNDRMLHPYAALVPDASALQTAPWAYEQLKYGLYYSFIKAGTAYIHNRGIVNINGRPAYLFQTTAFSASVIDTVFKVRDINQSWLDAAEFYSYGYGQSVREGNYKRDEWLEFDYPAKKYVGKIQKKEAPKTISGPLDIKVLDMLSALYYVRAQKLEVGKDISFDIINREKQYPLLVKVLKKETVKTPAGKFNCVIVEPQFRGEGIFVAKGKSLKVWLTDDEYKMPVKMSVEVFIGSVSAELLEYQRQAPVNIL